jgi:hypothetical protein
MICYFDKLTFRGTAANPSYPPLASEFVADLDIKILGDFLNTPARYTYQNTIFAEYQGWAAEQTQANVFVAVVKKIAEIEAKCQELQGARFEFNGHSYYCEQDDRDRNIPATALTTVWMADSDPIPTDQPYPGCWMTAPDADGVRAAIPFTCAQFRAFATAVYRRTSALWGKEKIHAYTVQGMALAGATAEQIAAYDVTQGWS